MKFSKLFGLMLGHTELAFYAFALYIVLKLDEDKRITLADKEFLTSDNFTLMALAMIAFNFLWLYGVHKGKDKTATYFAFTCCALFCLFLLAYCVFLPLISIRSAIHDVIEINNCKNSPKKDLIESNYNVAIVSTTYLIWVCIKQGFYSLVSMIENIIKSVVEYVVDWWNFLIADGLVIDDVQLNVVSHI